MKRSTATEPGATHATSRRRVRDAILVAFVLGALAALAAPACSSESDVNAACTPNVTKDGIRKVANGCDQFAICTKDPTHPAACCSPPPKDVSVADCLYGYGVAAPKGTGGSGLGGGTSTSGGTAGGGTAGGGTGGTTSSPDGGT